MNAHKRYLFLIFYPVHILGVMSIILTINSFTLANFLFLLLGWILICGFGSAVMLHRVISHRSIKLNSPILKFGQVISCLCIQGAPLWWASTHRGLHHKYADTEKDAHSPITNGKLHSYHGWLYTSGIDNIRIKYVTDLLRDKFLVWLTKNYMLVVFSIYIIAALISPQFLLWTLIVPAIISYHQESIVNSWCHGLSGYREFNTIDNSINRRILALFTWGQALHNNHHARPGDFDFSLGKVGFDPCVLFKWIGKNV